MTGEFKISQIYTSPYQKSDVEQLFVNKYVEPKIVDISATFNIL